ncbi:MAG TPA: carboxyl transferase domain-containing protein [Mycobacteriales bacterium]|nr:carboxyl transferase domain-containing protein [Mycobacteriales bacterium]
MTADWREPLLAGATLLDVRLARRDPARWPGYHPEPSVRAYRLKGHPERPGPVALTWDFGVQGGSFGEDDATVLQKACEHAVRERVPLITVLRTGGTRLQEGMAALVGIPRAVLALRSLAEAGLPHVSVADSPTTGGVWISVGSTADVRVAVEGAVVGFAGPRVVEALTGELPGPDSHNAEAAYAAGLVDAVLPRDQVVGWLQRTLAALAPPPPAAPPAPAPAAHDHQDIPPGDTGESLAGSPVDHGKGEAGGGWEQVLRARARTVGGRELLQGVLTHQVPLRAPRGDETVFATLGRLADVPVVAVALAAELGGRPTPDGYRLATRAYRLAGRLGLPVLSLVDTPGADPGPVAERDGIAPAMGEALDALLTCASPTVALVHGEGGSGGALAAAAADVVLVGPDSYFAPIGPEGATAALRRPAQECADRMRITPADLLALGFADAVGGTEDLAAHVHRLSAVPQEERLAARRSRWSAPLPGRL